MSSDLDGYLVAHSIMRDEDYCPCCGLALSAKSQCKNHGTIPHDAPIISTADRRAGNFISVDELHQ